MAFLDQGGLLDLPLPNLIGAHQVANAGIALAALRALGFGEAACAAAVTRAEWPARLQRLRRGPLVEAAGRAELWLDGGHNPAAGAALAEALGRLPPRPLHLVTGMLATKDAAGFLRPLAPLARSLHGVSIPGEAATLPAEATVAAARAAGFAEAAAAPDVAAAVAAISRRRPRRPHPDLRLALPRRPGAARERLRPATAHRRAGAPRKPMGSRACFGLARTLASTRCRPGRNTTKRRQRRFISRGRTGTLGSGGSGMNSASSPGGSWKRPCAQSPARQACLAASMRSRDEATKFHQM